VLILKTLIFMPIHLTMELRMDWLSHLIDMMSIHGRVDLRCLYGAPWRIVEERAHSSEIPYHVVLSGTAFLEDAAGGCPIRLDAGDILLVSDGAAHVLHDGSGAPPAPGRQRSISGIVTSENGVTGKRLDMLCGRFTITAGRSGLLRNNLPKRLVAHADGKSVGAQQGARLAALIEMIRAEATLEGLGSHAMVNSFCAALFTLAVRHAADAGIASTGLLSITAHARLGPALSAMFREPGRPWITSDLARLCGMSPATLARHFNEELGCSASDLLLEIRMTLATNKLQDTALSIGSVAESVGYRSEAAFQRIFKRHTSRTPAQWRREATGAKEKPSLLHPLIPKLRT
jgi:AraC family transcriptional activator of mtrCDE